MFYVCWLTCGENLYALFSADSLKMLALERVRGKFFTRAWGKTEKWNEKWEMLLIHQTVKLLGFIKGAESIPVLISIPLTGYLNEATLCEGKVGYYMCSLLTAVSAALMFFIGRSKSSTVKSSMSNGWVAWLHYTLRRARRASAGVCKLC